jgi:hypothetical protein
MDQTEAVNDKRSKRDPSQGLGQVAALHLQRVRSDGLRPGRVVGVEELDELRGRKHAGEAVQQPRPGPLFRGVTFLEDATDYEQWETLRMCEWMEDEGVALRDFFRTFLGAQRREKNMLLK